MNKKHISELQQDAANVNQHSERGSALTRKSIEKFGARLAGIVDRNNVIVDGNDRQIAYGELDLDEVEVIPANPTKPVYLRFDDLDLADPDNPARELQVALHRSAVESWTVDAEALMAHMQSGVEVDDWFRQDELDALMAELMPPATTDDTDPQIDKAAELQAKWQTQTGQLWALGEHRLIVGDCTDRATVERVMGGQRADMVFTDPPYNVASESRNYAADKSKAMSDLKNAEWDHDFDIMTLFPVIESVMEKNCAVYICTSQWLVQRVWEWMWSWSDFCFYNVWCKPNPMPSLSMRHWTWATELIAYAVRGKHVSNFPAGEHALNWWDIPKSKDTDHPTEKALEVVMRPIRFSSNPGAIVFDPFAGSGTTGIACHNLGRKARMIEIAPNYAAVILQRMAQHTGQTPRLVT